MRELRCSVCADVIGVYESLVVVSAGPARITSLAREPSVGSSGEDVIHATCASDALLVACDERATKGQHVECADGHTGARRRPAQ